MLDEYVTGPGRNCTCGVHVSECGFWRPVLAELGWSPDYQRDAVETAMRSQDYSVFARHLRALVLALSPNRFGVSCLASTSARLARIIQNNKNLFAALQRVHRPNLVIDSSKNGIRLLLLNAIFGADLRVLHVLRDGRAVTNSIRKHTDCTITRACEYWKRTNTDLHRVLRCIPKSKQTCIKYEDFCQNSDALVASILSDNKLKKSSSDSLRGLCERHNIHGSPSRLDPSKYEIRLDQSWKQEMSASDLDIFESIGGHMNRKFAYYE